MQLLLSQNKGNILARLFWYVRRLLNIKEQFLDTDEDNTNYMYMMCQIDVATFIKIANGYYVMVDENDVNRTIFILKGVVFINFIDKSTTKNLERLIHQRVIGQRIAVDSVTRALKRANFGLRDLNRPIASFIFAGTSGTGKTELSKAIAEAYFGSEQEFCRLDMSEYQTHESITSLIGPPPGYIGYEEGGILTSWVRKKPCSIVLFDEIEKAHKDLFNILLQLLDDGQITDSKGDIVSFSDTFIILTTNAGTKFFIKTKETILSKINPNVKTKRLKKSRVFNKNFYKKTSNQIDLQLGLFYSRKKPEKLLTPQIKLDSSLKQNFTVNEKDYLMLLLCSKFTNEIKLGKSTFFFGMNYFYANDFWEDFITPSLKCWTPKEKTSFVHPRVTVYDALKKDVLIELEKLFRPEIVNRFDDIIIFKQLSKKETKKISSILLSNLSKQLKEQNVTIYITRRLKNLVIELSYDSEYGARPLRRALSEYIENPLSESLLRGNFSKEQKVIVDLVLEKQTFGEKSKTKSLIKLLNFKLNKGMEVMHEKNAHNFSS